MLTWGSNQLNFMISLAGDHYDTGLGPRGTSGMYSEKYVVNAMNAMFRHALRALSLPQAENEGV